MRSSDQWQGRDRYVTMFGQAYAITAMQEASAMATIANGGVRIAPHIVKSWTNADGTVEVPDTSQPVQVMDATAASQLLTMMESVVEDDLGTAGAAKVPGYRVGVKTGTAETIIDGASGLVSTTAGIIPADAPRLRSLSCCTTEGGVGLIRFVGAAVWRHCAYRRRQPGYPGLHVVR